MKNKLKEVLKANGRSQVWMAEQLKVEVDTFGQWCRNRRQPTIFRLKEIAELLNVKMEDLI